MIQVGEVLDKYELLERVGQGGMAIVYRGLDRSLKRVVAVKILHGHLSDYQEARDRFEREAQAVAKLRHENILEIFDFAAREGESYIVTEFIEGQTLKQLITERPIKFPEIGAMLMLQVCRALAHAHAHKILHRDIKPENIMIRADGVVKLMDFGISHMVDLERLTVTGQLLGSPAYMAPEHVEGRPLDFRTDVFAVGIVLYQLCAGKLPFEGKNPHEVLKRIAECRFVDPRQVNPQIGNRLGRIILRAMSARPEDRFPAISEMQTALEQYLEESGIPADKVIAELGRYLMTPAPYELALGTRLVDHLTRVGTKLLADEQQAAALDVFDRVLTIDATNAKVLAILDGLNRKQRTKKVAAGIALALAIGGGATAIALRGNVAVDTPPSPDAGTPYVFDPNNKVIAHEPSVPDAPPAIEVDAAAPPVDAAQVAVAKVDAAVRGADAGAALDGPVAIAAIATKLHVTSAAAQYRVGSAGPWNDPTSAGDFEVTIDQPTDVTVRCREDACEERSLRIVPGVPATFQIAWLSGSVKAKCEIPDTQLEVDGKPGTLKEPFPVPFGAVTYTTRKVPVKFVGAGVSSKVFTVTVTAGKTTEVTCEPR